jgi:hypothetical protein
MQLIVSHQTFCDRRHIMTRAVSLNVVAPVR